MLHTRLAVVLLFVGVALADDAPVVQTTAGAVRGFFNTSRSGRRYLSFTGIPFAKPPLGPLRFKPPQEPSPWDGIRDATEDGPMCIQYNMFSLKPQVEGSEDCLHLTVHTPRIKGRAPVIFHIHGGGFISGDKSYTRPTFFMDHDVVVVHTNYRVGIMGFLSMEDKEQPGNQGMKDQVMALQWVQKNIAKFGGDPNKVTLVGESAGGASVIHHIISPLSRGLFHGGISESGSSYNTWTLLPPGLAKKRAQRLASLVNCPFGNTKEAVSCFQGKDAKELVGRFEDFREWQIDPLMLLFQPVLEPAGPGAFLTGPVSKWEHAPVPLLTGVTSADGFLRSVYFLLYKMDFKWYSDNFEKVAPLSFQYIESASNPAEITKKIRQYYFGGREITVGDWVNITNAYTDGWFAAGVLEGANKHKNDVYFYYFDYVGDYEANDGNDYYNSSFVIGAGHTAEILYLWDYDFLTLKGQDLQFSKKLVKMWADFAKYGKGVSPESSQIWKTWTAKRHRYLHISKTGFKQHEGLHEDRYRFWSSLNYKDKYE